MFWSGLFWKIFFLPFWSCEETQKSHFFPKCCRVLQYLNLCFQFLFPPLSICLIPSLLVELGTICWFAFPLSQKLGWQHYRVSFWAKIQPFLHSCPFHYWASLALYPNCLPNFLSCRKLSFQQQRQYFELQGCTYLG